MTEGDLFLGAAIFGLTATSVGGIAWLFYQPVAPRDPFEERASKIAGGPIRRGRLPMEDDETIGRRKTVERTIREIEERQKAVVKNGKLTFAGKIRQAGLRWTRRTYYVAGACCAAAAVALASSASLPEMALPVAAIAGFMVPRWHVGRCRRKRFAKFSDDFANAVDVIARGIRTGLPLGDCLKVVASESPEPIRGEFTTLVHDTMLGVPMDVAARRLAERIPMPETSFFATVLGTQSRAGGSLSEALGNLSGVLRDRKQLRGRIKAVSSEAVASAGIIGTMPVIVAGLVWLASPDYVELMFNTFTGQAVLAASAVWMAIGVAVMRRMINFEY